MSETVSRVSAATSVHSYASYTSSSDDANDSSHDHAAPHPPHDVSSVPHPPQLASDKLPTDFAAHLNISHPYSSPFDSADYNQSSSDDDHSDDSETVSNGSYSLSYTDSNHIPVPCTTMDECVGTSNNVNNDTTDVTEESQYHLDAKQRTNPYARLSSTALHSTCDNHHDNHHDNDDSTDPSQIRPQRSSASSSSAVMSNLKKRWKGMKKAGAKGTSSAGKSLSSISSTYFGGGRDNETWEERHSRIGDEWVTCLIPAWRKKRKTARVRTLVFRGIPANVRGRVWQCAIGNPLNISAELFTVLKDRAVKGREEYVRGRETLALADGDLGGHGGRAEGLMENERSAHKAISLDLPRTFPELSFFHAEGSHYEHALRDILEAFLYLKPEVGYSQGMSFVAAVLLLYMDPYEAFCCFANMLLYKSCFLHFFRIKMPEVRCYLMVHDRLLAEDMPALHVHFKQHNIEADLYMINWVMSLYCRALPLDLVTRIWDLYVLDGDVAIFRAALGILRMFMPRLLKMKFEDMAYFLSHLPGNEIDADVMLQSIRSIRIVTRRRFYDLFRDCRAAIDKDGDDAV